jgi:hypothetical protein
MPENYIELPDGKKLVIFETNQHPDFPATIVNVQESLTADIPTYQVVADNITPAVNKNIIAIFSRLATKRIRIQKVYVYSRSLAATTVTLQLGYINTLPTGGTDLTLIKHAFDFPNNPAAPDDVVAKAESTATPVAGVIFGGCTMSLNDAVECTVFEASRNGSALQLRPGGVDGIVLRETAGTGTAGALTAHVVFTLD